MANTCPVIFLAFANDRANNMRYLRNLPEEQRRLREALRAAEQRGLCEVVLRNNVTHKDLLDVLQDARYRNRVALFHFGGHGGGNQIMLESAEGGRSDMFAGGLAALLGEQRGLELVFLNGCSTGPQVEGLLEAGVPSVIATGQSIDDAMATMFSTSFYKAVAEGTPLGVAYRESEATVRSQFGDRADRFYRDLEEEEVEVDNLHWPWALTIRPGAEETEAWSLPKAVGDYLFGLPELPQGELPDKPYRHLYWFTDKDAEIFFGRGRHVRKLYEAVLDSEESPITLVYGPTGVGKSSLLAAGLVPRLSADREVIYARRSRELGLTGSLAEALGVEARLGDRRWDPAQAIEAAWRERETSADRPLVVILDQVEEVYTQPRFEETDELALFMETLVALFKRRSKRPRGHLLLGFRKEWLAEFLARFGEYKLPRILVELEALDREGIIEATEGPSRSERLKTQYNLSIEEELAGIIADDLLEDRSAAIAPTLQILLARLWDSAVAANPSSPTFTVKLYQEMKKEGVLLDDFLNQQFQKIHGEDPDAVESGLLLNILTHHTTVMGTAETRAAEALMARYSHHSETMPTLLQRCLDSYLLIGSLIFKEGRWLGDFRLAHDTLAPLVRHRFEESALPGQRAARILNQRMRDWSEGEAPLDESSLALVEAGHHGMHAWTEGEQKLVEASRRLQLKRSQQRRVIGILGLAAMILIALSSVVAWFLYGKSEESAKEARMERDKAEISELTSRREKARAERREAQARRLLNVSKAQYLAGRSVTERKSGNHLQAALLVKQAFHFHDRSHSNVIGLIDRSARALLVEPFVRFIHDGHTNHINGVSFSPDGELIASASRDGQVRLWKVSDPRATPIVLTGQGKELNAALFSPDGKTLATAGSDGSVWLWDTQNYDAPSVILQGHKGDVIRLAFNSAGTKLASSGSDKTVRLWHLDAREGGVVPSSVLSAHENVVIPVAFSPDGTKLASGGLDATIHLWDVSRKNPVMVRQIAHTEMVFALAFTGEGDKLISGGSDGLVRVWSMADQGAEPARSWRAHKGSIFGLSISPDGKLVTSGADNKARLWSLDKPREPLATMEGHQGFVNSVAFSPGGARIVTGGRDNKLFLWELSAPVAITRAFTGHQNIITSVAFSPKGQWLASGSWDKSVRLWPLEEGVESVELVGHEKFVIKVAFDHKGERVATASLDRTVRIWSVPSGEVQTILKHEHGVHSVAFSPDDSMVATAGVGGEVTLWRPESPEAPDAIFNGQHEGTVNDLDFSHDGALLATVGEDGRLKLWSVKQPEIEAREAPDGIHGNLVSVAFHPTRRQVAMANVEGFVALWDVDQPKSSLRIVARERFPVLSVSFNQEGTQLAAASKEGTVRVWDMDRLEADPTLFAGSQERVLSLSFSPKGDLMATAGEDRIVRVSALTDAMLEPLCARIWRNLSWEEWRTNVGKGMPYEQTCPSRPVHDSVTQIAALDAKAGASNAAVMAVFAPDLRPIARALVVDALIAMSHDLDDKGDLEAAAKIHKRALQLKKGGEEIEETIEGEL